MKRGGGKRKEGEKAPAIPETTTERIKERVKKGKKGEEEASQNPFEPQEGEKGSNPISQASIRK